MGRKIETTIVISNYNYGSFVCDSIESCINQTIPCQIIVVDDASTDDSWEKINKYAGDRCCVIRLLENSGGNARGKNIGICLSKSKYITCLDSDDLLLPDSIEKRTNILKKYKFLRWVHGTSIPLVNNKKYNYDIIMEITKKSKSIKAKYLKFYNGKNLKLDKNDIEWYKQIEASTVITYKNIYDKFGLYDEELKWKIDREMWFRFLNNKVERLFIDYPVSIYRKHEKQATRNKNIKDPNVINKIFKKIIRIRNDHIDEGNTYMPNKYYYKKYIMDIKGAII